GGSYRTFDMHSLESSLIDI
nr:Chain D, Cytoplasmic polyadenylation element-binding protein 4 [Homo sapiens]